MIIGEDFAPTSEIHRIEGIQKSSSNIGRPTLDDNARDEFDEVGVNRVLTAEIWSEARSIPRGQKSKTRHSLRE
jgi:hypothetical protein